MTDVAVTTPNDGQAKQQVVAYTQKSQDKHESRHIQLVREYGFHPRSKVSVEDGGVLPKKFEPFPQNMYGKPLEEIDNFIYEETFCVVSKRFRKNYIHRFSGTKSLWWFTPWSPTRRACVCLATNQFFDYLVMATILFNCIFLAMTETFEEAEYIFLVIYTCEMVIKIIAKGFVLNKYSYLRNPWNWLDFVVITSGYATIGMEVGNLAGLRTFRVLRALKTISIMPGLKTIINALLHSFKQLAEVMTLTIFCLMVFALFALQVYMGELRHKCVKNFPDGWNLTEEDWRSWINNTENWLFNDDGLPILCGNLTGARHCPPEHTCLCVGENPNHGYTNFDNFMWSMLTTFQLITLDYWENVYNMLLATSGPMSVSFFTVVVFFGSFYLINLMLAVVALSYEEEAEITQEERKKDLLDHRDDSTFSFDPSNLNVKKLNKHQRKKIDSRKGVLLASYSRKKTRRRKKGKDGCNDNGGNGNNNSNNNSNNSVSSLANNNNDNPNGNDNNNSNDNNNTNGNSNNNNNNSNNDNDENNSRSVTPSPSPSPRHSNIRPQVLQLQRTRGITTNINLNQGAQQQNPNTLHPLGTVNYHGQLLPNSRQASSNASEGGVNRESSLDDSGVVDDHDDQDPANSELIPAGIIQKELTPVAMALSPREIRIIKCNGNIAKLKKHNLYALHPEYLSQIVVLDDLPDRNCDRCVQCCVDYEGWLQFQNCLYKIVRDPLFELAITLCIVLNTMFLALEHHGMSESVRQALDIGNKVFTSIFTFECILKLMALSKDFFLCGWNIFDLIIVSASLIDIIFELVDGLSVLRGLRLLRVLKLAQSWTTMKVLLSIIISTIGALGNLTLVLVIVIYIFAVIGMQLFSKDYTPDKFYPDPVPRWNFNDFFHSFMMIFRILCGEWIEPLWDCMRAEEEEGASSCFAIFLPTLVMGNFMVLNLFLALLLNSFNSEELKSKKEEVGEDSKLARSFERIRSIVRKKKWRRENNENEKNSKLEQIVNEVIIKQKNEKLRYGLNVPQYATIELPSTTIYRHSYQESLNRPISGSDFYDIPLKPPFALKTISGSQETVKEVDGNQLPEDQINLHLNRDDDSGADHNNIINVNKRLQNFEERKLLYQMSSGFGTQQNDSRDEPTITESLELRTLGPINNNDLQFYEQAIHCNVIDSEDQMNRQKSLDYSTASRTYSIKSIEQIPGTSSTLDNRYYSNNNNIRINNDQHAAEIRKRYSADHLVTKQTSLEDGRNILKVSPTIRLVKRSPSYHKSMNRLPSDLSINTLSIDQDDLLNQSNLRDELLNCEQKELFQFLNDDFNENSVNYFSETVGYSNAIVDNDTDSLLYNEERSQSINGFSPSRKISNGSLKSNFSNISNSIFQKLEARRGGSLAGSVDRLFNNSGGGSGSAKSDIEHKLKRISDPISYLSESDREPLVQDSEFDDIIQSFDKELSEIKASTTSLDNNLADSSSKETILRRPRSKVYSHEELESIKIKRRSLEKQKKIIHESCMANNNIDDDDGFNMTAEIRKICEQLQAPFGDATIVSPVMRKKADFHNSLDRIKRISLIDRVDELNENEPIMKVESEKLPRKNFLLDNGTETLSLKSNDSMDKISSNPVAQPQPEQISKMQIQLPQKPQSIHLMRTHTPTERTRLLEDTSYMSKSPHLKKSVTLHEQTQLVDGDDKSKKKSSTFNTKGSPKSKNMKNENSFAQKPLHCLVSYVDDLTVGGRRNSKGVFEDPMAFPSFGQHKPPKVPQDCFPQGCYDELPCMLKCIETDCGQKWTKLRTAILSVVDTPAFEWFVLVLIFASSITLCFEDIHLDNNKQLKRVLYWTNLGFCLIFLIEMFLKWLAQGFLKYFSSFWTILDFIIVFVSVFSLLIEENENLRVLRSLRTLRALRPLRAISRWQGMRIVVNALMYAIPSIFNVLLVCLVFWLIFSIMGVQFFGGKFFKCIDEEGELLPITIVNDRWQCVELNYSWINSKITFDHVGMGYLALLQVATFEGWMEVMADAVDARGVDLQPQREANLYAYIYFVIFIVCGSFFTLNLFIGVIIDNFNMLKKKYEGGVLEMFLTESQKHYYTAMKKLGRKKPQKVIKRPINKVLAMFYDLSNSRRFEIAIFVLIFFNMLSMGIEHYNQPHAVFFLLEVSNAFFTTVFGLEAIVKIVGLRYHYFTVPWNVFDFLLVLASILGILMEDIMIDLPISPTLLRVVRVFRIGRILRLIKAAKGIRKLLFALVVSLPALFNIGALLALITFIYAILGMSLFGHVRLQGALDDMVNFQTFGRSMQLLFRLMTSAGWNDVLESLMIQPPDCDIEFNSQTNGDCGHPLLAITYFTSFIIISYMIVINMYIAIILENFNQAHQEEEIGIVEDDLEMFYIRWSKYDPHASQFIHFSQLSDFIASLDPPLGIPKPNTVALVSFNLPISRGNKIHCLDILHALVKHVLGHVEETDNFKQLQEQMDVKFKKQFPTRKELEIVSSTRIWKREDKAAKLIQSTWKEYLRLKKERERSPMSLEDDNTQNSSPGGWHSKLSALNFLHLQVHRRGTATSSRCSSRKSSRASDASDISELAGPWLNLPMMILPGTGDLVKDIKHGESGGGEMKPQRRRSFYNFFLRHQDAVDDALTSPNVQKRSMTKSGTILSLNTASTDNKTAAPSVNTPKSKRATSFVRKKPPLERGLSAQSALRVNRNAFVSDEPATSSPDVSILVTEPSPEAPPPSPYNKLGETTLVHVLVHRESEEYKSDVEDGETTPDKPLRGPEIKISPGSDDYTYQPPRRHSTNTLEPMPTVTICVQSPTDPPCGDFTQTPVVEGTNDQIESHEPIDVNAQRDTTNIYYEYNEPPESGYDPPPSNAQNETNNQISSSSMTQSASPIPNMDELIKFDYENEKSGQSSS